MEALETNISDAQLLAERWNRFWFTPQNALPLCVLRVIVGLASLYFVLSYTADLTTWFGPAGLLPAATVQELQVSEDIAVTGQQQTLWRVSVFDYINDPTALLVVHFVFCLAPLCLLLGVFSRISAVACLLVVLNYVHRAPMLSGQFEPVLTMLLCYLCLGPCGQRLSIDAWWGRRSPNSPSAAAPQESIAANISLRLIQVHLCAFYLMIGLTKFGSPHVTWFDGGAMWWLITRSDVRMLDLTWLHQHIYVINIWTHAVLAMELAFPVLIWISGFRRWVLIASTISWLLLAPVTGLPAYCLLMIGAGAVFISTATWEKRLARFAPEAAA